jgi:hypothetical protein
MAHPRGPVEIKGVTTRVNSNDDRVCECCKESIAYGLPYERVARTDEAIESYHQPCFAAEFGERRLYGD